MYRIASMWFIALIFLAACQTDSRARNQVAAAPVRAYGGNPASIAEVQEFIEYLNGVIRARDYEAWVVFLDPDFHAMLDSFEFLARVSRSPALASQRIVLRSARDFFYYVVVPSRVNDRVDAIKFLSCYQVQAFTVTNAGVRLILHNLKRTDNQWRVFN